MQAWKGNALDWRKMKKQTIQEFIDLHYRGDSSRVKFVKLNYSQVRTASQLIAWASTTFGVPLGSGGTHAQPESFLWSLFRALGERGQHYIVLESYLRHMTPEIRETMEGGRSWRGTLGYGLFRDHVVHVAFFQDPETKGKRP
ncbi:MAG: hypothetical protein RBU25_03900 [Lentisphaeria bacterium]|jgi:hypothetical protein|nr:hypothetical protein [Lentisphaeria bacterium]